MICAKCGKSNADNFRFCQFCGAAMKNAQVDLELSAEFLPNASVTTPESLEDWLSGDIQNADINIPADLDLPERTRSSDMLAIELDLDDDPLMPGSFNLNVGKNTYDEQLAKSLSKLIEFDPKPTSAKQISSQQRALRICKQCGAAITDGYRFCGNCGAKSDSGPAMHPISQDSGENASVRHGAERVGYMPTQVARPDYAMFTLFHINDDGTPAEVIPLYEGQNIIGRSSSILLGSDRFVNPKHMKITCNRHIALVEDCNSLNGVFLRITDEAVPLMHGDVFRIGEELIAYCEGDSSQMLFKKRTTEPTALIGSPELPGWGYLKLILGPYAEGCVYRLSQKSVSLGRKNADILFPKDGFVSGKHASISLSGEMAMLTDLNSSNGTFVKLKMPMQVEETTYFLIGNQLLCIKPR